MRTGKAGAGHRAGKACNRRWHAYGKCSPSEPEVGAGCGKAACPDLCGGRGVILVPTATSGVVALHESGIGPKETCQPRRPMSAVWVDRTQHGHRLRPQTAISCGPDLGRGAKILNCAMPARLATGFMACPKQHTGAAPPTNIRQPVDIPSARRRNSFCRSVSSWASRTALTRASNRSGATWPSKAMASSLLPWADSLKVAAAMS